MFFNSQVAFSFGAIGCEAKFKEIRTQGFHDHPIPKVVLTMAHVVAWDFARWAM